MITIFVGEHNPLTPNFYNNLIAQLQFHRLTCTCGHSGCLSVHGYYIRSLKVPAGKLFFRICRLICSCCHHTHALLPSFMVPYSQISMNEQAEVTCAEYEKNYGDKVTDAMSVRDRLRQKEQIVKARETSRVYQARQKDKGAR